MTPIMPEGPEVKRMVADLQAVSGKTIQTTVVVSGRYSRGVIHNIEKLDGAVVEKIISKGKLIVFYMRGEEQFCVLSTMGMTGWWVCLKDVDHAWSKHRRLELQFTDGTSAVFFDQRNFGTFKVVSPNEAKRKMAELGPDILAEPSEWWSIGLDEFTLRLALFGKRQTIAEALMDQRVCSGCGNYIRADALYLARVSPIINAAILTDAQIQNIWKAMHLIATSSLANEAPFADLTNLKGSRIDSHGFSNLCYGQTQTPTGGEVQSYVDSNGRTVWYSPSEQH